MPRDRVGTGLGPRVNNHDLLYARVGLQYIEDTRSVGLARCKKKYARIKHAVLYTRMGIAHVTIRDVLGLGWASRYA